MSRGWAKASGVCLTAALTSLVLLSGAGCLPKQALRIVHESGTGSVYFEDLPATPVRATQPMLINPRTMARVLQGVRIQEQVGDGSPSRADKPPTTRAFSQKDIEFLAPYLSSALIMAGRDRRISFRVIHPTEFGPAATAATLYAHGAFLYLTMTHLDYRAVNPEALYIAKTPLPYSTALTRRTVRFIPKTAGRPRDDIPSGASTHPTLTTLAIDHRRLAEAEEAGPTQPRVTIESTVRIAAARLALKHVIQALKGRLDERDKLIKTLTMKKATRNKKVTRKKTIRKKTTGIKKKTIAPKKRKAPPRPAPVAVAKRPPQDIKPAPAAPTAPPPPTPPVKAQPDKKLSQAKPDPPPDVVDEKAPPEKGTSEGPPEPTPAPPKEPTFMLTEAAEDKVHGGFFVGIFVAMLAFAGVRRFSHRR